MFLMYRIYSPAPIHHLSSSPILFYLNMSKTKFVLQIYKQYFNFPNFYEKNLNCGPNENRTRVSTVTEWKDNHYPMRPVIITGIFNVISDGDGFEPPNLSCFYNLIKNVKPNKTLLYDSFLLREIDSNYRPHGYEPRELTNCSTPQFMLLTGNVFSSVHNKIVKRIAVCFLIFFLMQI